LPSNTLQSSNDGPASPIDLAVDKLRESMNRLCKVTAVLDAEYPSLPSSLEKEYLNPRSNAFNIDLALENLRRLTGQLLAKEHKDSQKSYIVRFVETACRTVAPAVNTILTTLPTQVFPCILLMSRFLF